VNAADDTAAKLRLLLDGLVSAVETIEALAHVVGSEGLTQTAAEARKHAEVLRQILAAAEGRTP
jgi:hypothetical protein